MKDMNENSKRHVDSCRFCWMCRHICPIGNATGLERHTSRARALGISLVNRGTLELKNVIDTVYECACCGASTKECVTGWDPVMFTKEARLDGALEGVLPEYINRMVDNCLEKGNAYGITAIDHALGHAIERHAAFKDTLLFLGVDARYKAAEAAIKAIQVLEKAGVEFTVLEQEPPSGWQLEYLVSAANETNVQMKQCAEILNNFGSIIVFDPQDAKVFKREYKEWGVRIETGVETFTSYLAGLLREKRLNPGADKVEVAYQDPFQLSRDLGETEEARMVIRAYAVCKEMLCHGKDTMWAGNILMKEWMPEVILQVAAARIRNARNVRVNTIVTASVSEYVSLKDVEQNDVKIVSLEELILGE